MPNFDIRRAVEYGMAPLSGYMTSVAQQRISEDEARNALIKSMISSGQYEMPPGYMEQMGLGGWQKRQPQPIGMPEDDRYIKSIKVDPKGGQTVTWGLREEKKKPEAQILTGRAPTPRGLAKGAATIPVRPFMAPKRVGLPPIAKPPTEKVTATDRKIIGMIRQLRAANASIEDIQEAIRFEGVEPKKYLEELRGYQPEPQRKGWFGR